MNAGTSKDMISFEFRNRLRPLLSLRSDRIEHELGLLSGINNKRIQPVSVPQFGASLQKLTLVCKKNANFGSKVDSCATFAQLPRIYSPIMVFAPVLELVCCNGSSLGLRPLPCKPRLLLTASCMLPWKEYSRLFGCSQ